VPQKRLFEREVYRKVLDDIRQAGSDSSGLSPEAQMLKGSLTTGCYRGSQSGTHGVVAWDDLEGWLSMRPHECAQCERHFLSRATSQWRCRCGSLCICNGGMEEWCGDYDETGHPAELFRLEQEAHKARREESAAWAEAAAKKYNIVLRPTYRGNQTGYEGVRKVVPRGRSGELKKLFEARGSTLAHAGKTKPLGTFVSVEEAAF
jgi:hypothetical protein